MIYILLLVSVGFLAINLHITKHDYLNPAVIFCGVFVISEILCMLFQKAYAITFHYKTAIVLFLGFLPFTLINWYFIKKKKTDTESTDITDIAVPDWIMYVFIAMQIAAIIAFVIYLKNLSVTYDGKARSLSEMISLYNTMTKFWRKKFLKLNVPIPIVYRVLNPFVHLGGYVSVYILINNWFAKHKADIRCIVSILMLCVLIFLNGSRSPILRIITMAIALYYILGRRCNKVQKGDIKAIGRFILPALLAVIALVLMVKVIRPNISIGDFENYLFIYSGAPLVNLDTWLKQFDGALKGFMFGEQTFRHLYNYIGKWMGIRKLEVYDSINTFAFSANGKEIGNVYTCFYYLLFDFSYAGMVPMIGIMAYYYLHEYYRCLREKIVSCGFDIRTFIYVYLFDDLVMSFFSTRFYETVFSPEFIKMCAVLLLWKLISMIKCRLFKADAI